MYLLVVFGSNGTRRWFELFILNIPNEEKRDNKRQLNCVLKCDVLGMS